MQVLNRLLKPQDEGRYTGTGEVTRPDGVYSWEIE